jgi:hypothetical protein
MKKVKRKNKAKTEKKLNWHRFSDEKLLDLRFCDLGISIQGSVLEMRIRHIYKELEKKGITFKPHFWFSDEWFSPDGIPGVAIPFYLAHPRLSRLERSQMLEVEGGTYDWCMMILRHEVGHAIDNAFKLRKRRLRQRIFGKSTQAYPEFYAPKPYSKSFVLHLDSWYAQSHPDEDFAETFAVWLSQDPEWRYRYSEWPALKKLEYVDNLMNELRGRKAHIRSQAQIDPVSKLKTTLRQHYQQKRARYAKQFPNFYDRDLRRLFSDAEEFKDNQKASLFIKSISKELRNSLARWTGEYQYTINQVINQMIQRSDELNLRLAMSPETAKTQFVMLLTVQTMNYLHSGRHRIAL